MDIFKLAEEHFNEVTEPVSSIPPYGTCWEGPYQTMRSLMGRFASVKDLVHCVQDWRVLPFGHREPANPAQIDECLRIFKEEFPNFNFLDTSDEPLSVPHTVKEINGNYFSNMHLWHGWSWLTILNNTKNVKNILEIGGGYGALARLWLKYSDINRYVIVDVPETLFFAEVYLRHSFGSDVGYYIDQDPGTKVVLIPVDRHSSYSKSSDVVINIGSLQEMPNIWVEHYMKYLDTYDARYFYSLNYTTQPVSAKWNLILMKRDPAVIKLTCNDSFLAALYEKAP